MVVTVLLLNISNKCLRVRCDVHPCYSLWELSGMCDALFVINYICQ